MKLLRFESHKIKFFAFDEKGPLLNLKKCCIINGLRPLCMRDSFFEVAKERVIPLREPKVA